MPIDERIIRRIVKLLDEDGISRNDLAEMAGMSKAALSNLLNGKTSDIKLSTIQRIADALNCDVEVILRERDAE